MEILEISTESQKTIDAAIIVTALRYYKKDVAPGATAQLMADLSRLITEYDKTAKIPLHVGDDGQLIIAGPDNLDPVQVTNINTL